MFDVKVTSFILIKKYSVFLSQFQFFFSDISFNNKGHSAKEVISAIPLDNQSCPVVE